MRSLDFVITGIRFFMKLFNTVVIDIVKLCQDYFGFDLLSSIIAIIIIINLFIYLFIKHHNKKHSKTERM